MPYGKGTYGSKVGRPPKKKTTAKPKKKPMKKGKTQKIVLDILSKICYNIPIVYLSILYKLTIKDCP